MSFSNLTTWASPKPSILPDFDSLSSRSLIAPSRFFPASPSPSSRRVPSTAVHCGLRELRERIDSVKNTQKITEAMKLVAAAKVRRAQEAVVSGRPFSETLVEVLYNINEQLQNDDIDIPLTKVCLIKKIALIVITGNRGLYGGFDNYIIKKVESCLTDYGLVPSLFPPPTMTTTSTYPPSSSTTPLRPATPAPTPPPTPTSIASVFCSLSSSLARPPSKTLLRSTALTSPGG